MFKKDDYIVLLENFNSRFSENFCYKQREECNYLQPYFDLEENTDNGHPSIKYISSKKWRYATSEEIEHYDSIGKPYDVTTITKENPLITEAKRRYPVGTKFYPAHLNNKRENTICVVPENFEIVEENGFITLNKVEDKSEYLFNSTGYIMWLYHNGKWAEIIEEPKKSVITLNKNTVKVGQKVRVIADSAKDLGFTMSGNNWGYKKGHVGIITEILEEYPDSPVHSWVYLDDKRQGGMGIATMLLELLEEPKEENLVGRYLKALVDYPQCIDNKKGSYFLITEHEDNDLSITDIARDMTGFGVDKPKIGTVWELMPEGFKPEEPSKFIVGKWYKHKDNSSGYLKFLRQESRDLHYSERIWADTTYEKKSGYASWNFKDTIEVDLSEIQQYLSDGHPDKFCKLPEETSQNFKVGDWVVVQPEKFKDSFYINVKSFSNELPIKALQIECFSNNGHENEKDKYLRFYGYVYDHPIDCFRKATFQEVLDAADPMFKDYPLTPKECFKPSGTYGTLGYKKPSENSSIDEILEYCKAIYKEGMEIIPLTSSGNKYSKSVQLKGEIKYFLYLSQICIGSNATSGFVYVNGKYAEIVNSSTTINLAKQHIPSMDSYQKLPWFLKDEDLLEFTYKQVGIHLPKTSDELPVMVKSKKPSKSVIQVNNQPELVLVTNKKKTNKFNLITN